MPDTIDQKTKRRGISAEIIVPSVLVYELNVTLEEVTKILKKFCKHGEAVKKKVGSITLFDFPGTRIYLTKLENQIIELLRDNPNGLTRSTLLSLTKLSIDALNEILKRLESEGVIFHDIESDTYMLRGLIPLTTPDMDNFKSLL